VTVVGINEILVSNLSVLATGIARDYADTAAFLLAGYNLTWYDEDGVAVSPQPTWSLVRSDTNGDHFFQAEVVLGAYAVKMTVPATDYASITLWSGRGTSYGIDDIGSAIAASGGISLSPTAVADTAEMFDGDSIRVLMFVPDEALTRIGAASLAACDDIEAFIKLDSVDSDQPPTVDDAALTKAIITDSSGDRSVLVTLDDFPEALKVVDGTRSTQCTVHLRLTEGAKIIIASEIALTVKWSAPEEDTP
jgi:hypothetical protein